MPPAEIHDHVLGDLTWADKFHWYEGDIAFTPKHDVDIRIDWYEDAGTVEHVFELARQMLMPVGEFRRAGTCG